MRSSALCNSPNTVVAPITSSITLTTVATTPCRGTLALATSPCTAVAPSSPIRPPSWAAISPRTASSPKTEPATAITMISSGAMENSGVVGERRAHARRIVVDPCTYGGAHQVPDLGRCPRGTWRRLLSGVCHHLGGSTPICNVARPELFYLRPRASSNGGRYFPSRSESPGVARSMVSLRRSHESRVACLAFSQVSVDEPRAPSQSRINSVSAAENGRLP